MTGLLQWSAYDI